MERFAKIKNIGTRRKLDITAICRCCGLENDEKYAVLGQNPFSDDGVEFSEKVQKLTGINVTRTDKMPQQMCIMCMDKINDFYEFRLMAENTEKQTREALGLPPPPAFGLPPIQSTAQLPPPRIIIRQKVVEVKPLAVRIVDIKHSVQDQILIDHALGRSKVKTETIPSSASKKRTEKATAASQPPTKKSKKELSCTICADSQFSYQSDLNDHLMKEHIPYIAKYACGSCRETFEQLADFKAHENIHSKEKMPYTCFICLYSYGKLKDFNKHMTNYNCKEKEKLPVTVEDIKCFQCKKKFLTQNLFEWHGCFLKTRGSCSKCGQFYQKKTMLFKHYVLCEGRFEAPEAACDPALRFKLENANFRAPVKVSTTGASPPPKTKKGPKKKTVPQRKMSTLPSIVKTELQLDAPPEDDDYANYEEDITYDNFGNDSDSDDAPDGPSLEPLVELQEPSAVRIKLERVSDPPAVQHSSSSATEDSTVSPVEQEASPSTAELIRNIKKEKGASQTMNVVTTNKPALTQQQKNMWKLKIKAERSGSDQPVVQVLNPMAVGAIQTPTVKKNVFKIPQGLAMKIKLEKKDAGYGDNVEERDEAEPEDEDLLADAPESPVVNIKEEKIDPAYGDNKIPNNPAEERDEAEPEDEDLMADVPVSPIVKIKKEKIDPAYGDACKPANKNKQLINPMALLMRDKPLSNGYPEKSLVISAVTSINPDSPGEMEADGDDATAQNNIASNSHETEETNDVMVAEKSRESSPKMVQIPLEFLENQENHVEESTTAVEEKLPEPMDTNDDLDALLKIYEDTAPSDNNDLFQELLKFD